MKEETIIRLLAADLLLCLIALVLLAVYFLYQWRKLDIILEEFSRGTVPEEDLSASHGAGQRREAEHGRGGRNIPAVPVHRRRLSCSDLLDTRESRVVSQLKRILWSAQFKQKQAAGEKDQVMQLISDISHQLKTPLANIIMNMELLQDPGLSEERRREFLEHTKSQADKMQWLMANLLKASRLENGMISFDAAYTGIKATIAKAVGFVFAQASAKKIELIVEEFQDVTLYHNPKWTAEAMSNILENAVKYSPAGSSIKIRLERLELYTKITISDEGIGIPRSEFHSIFQRFYRGSEVEQQEGSGLGLYLAQLILQCEKGYITVSSQVGQGSSFSLFLLNEPK